MVVIIKAIFISDPFHNNNTQHTDKEKTMKKNRKKIDMVKAMKKKVEQHRRTI